MSTMMANPKIDLDKTTADLCRGNFFEFVKEFWHVLNTDEPEWNWHIEYLCGVFQEAAERVMANEPRPYDIIVNVPPGSTKSTIFSIMGPAWVWTRMPHCCFICGSHTYLLALDLATKARDVITSEQYQKLFPEIIIRDDQSSKGFYKNTKNGFRWSVGSDGSVIGQHAHIIIIDDPIDPTASASEEMLKTVNSWVNTTLPSRKKNKKTAVTFLIMQRLHQDDPSGHILDSGRRDIKHICLPAELEKTVKPRALRRFYVDGLLDPVRLPRAALQEAEKQLGISGYSCQFRQNPIPIGGAMFDIDKIILRRPPPLSSFKTLARYWDKAATEKSGCYTVGFLMGEQALSDDTSHYWILDVIRGQWNSAYRERLIWTTAQNDGYTTIIGVEQEPGSGGLESAQATARRLAGFHVILDKVTGDKELRADPFSDQVNAGNVSMAIGKWNKTLLDEMQYFPASRYKDQVDAGSGAFAMLTRPKRRAGALHGVRRAGKFYRPKRH